MTTQRRSESGPIIVRRRGSGPEVLLVHGGASPRTTWLGLESLLDHWTLTLAYRRGYPPSPPGQHDFETDAADLLPLLDNRPHVVAHSYGTLGSVLATAVRPDQVRSLTLIEPPFYSLAPDDPDVAHIQRVGDDVQRNGLAADPRGLREFLVIAGAPDIDDGPLPDAAAAGVRRAHGGRLVSEFVPPIDRLQAAGVPTLVASGAHHPGVERICDAVAGTLGASRVTSPGGGHFVPRAPGFADELDRFLRRHT